METINKIAISFILFFSFISCKNSPNLLPNVSGKAGEVLVVISNEQWQGNIGEVIRKILTQPCEGLPQREAMYSPTYVSPTGFTKLFKIHRNIIRISIDAQKKEGIFIRQDVWATPQTIISINACSTESFVKILSENSDKIINILEQAERDRVITNCIQYENKEIAKQVNKLFGGSPHFPIGYKLRKSSENFVWIENRKQYSTQGIFIYRYPANENDNFDLDKIISKRNQILKENVPGQFENTYMTTGKYVKPIIKFIKYKKRDFAEVKGLWEVENDFMGGPFVSHSFYSKDGKDIIVMETWVYAPKYSKRQYLRQTESILFSFEWEKERKNQ